MERGNPSRLCRRLCWPMMRANTTLQSLVNNNRIGLPVFGLVAIQEQQAHLRR